MDAHQDSTMTVQTEQSPSNSTGEEIMDAHQDSTVQTEQSSSSNSGINIQDSTMTVPTEQSPSSNSGINIQDSPVEDRSKVPRKMMVVYVLPYSGESKAAANGIPVTVKKSDNVKELRNEVVKLQERSELNLPQEEYFFIHKQRLLNENQSFWVNGVDHDDTIEIIPKDLTRCSFTLDS